jgi:membrane fusion protein, multidrug efflux system
MQDLDGLKMLAGYVALAGILCVTAACRGSADPAKTVGPEVDVMTLQPQRVMLVTELPGQTSAFRTVEVRSRVTGTVIARRFEEGTDVKAGQVLYLIDPRTYQIAFNSAKASLALAEAIESRARTRVLHEIGQQGDDAKASYEVAQADVVAARAARDKARVELAATRVMAPISGRIGSSTTPGGGVVANEPTPMTTVSQIDPIYVELTASVTDILRLEQERSSGERQQADGAPGQVGLRLADGSVYAHVGQLQFSDVAVPGRDSVTVRVVFPNPEGLLLPGMSVRVQVQEGVRNQALLVPRRSVVRDMTGHASVLVLGTSNRVEVRPITIERMSGDHLLIGTGLKAGERIVIHGFQRVRPGIIVTPAPSPANAPRAAGKHGDVVAATSGRMATASVDA